MSDWDKLFSHAPFKTGYLTAQLFIESLKHICSFLIWEGRARYTRNSLGDKNVFWSFLFKKSPCYRLGRKDLTMYKKGIKHINQLINSDER